MGLADFIDPADSKTQQDFEDDIQQGFQNGFEVPDTGPSTDTGECEQSIPCGPSGISSVRLNNPITQTESIARELPSDLLENGSPVTWDIARNRYERHVVGEYCSSYGNTHQKRALSNYAKVLANDRKWCYWLKDCHIAMVTLRGSQVDENGDWLSILDSLAGLNESQSNVKDSLRYSMRDRRYHWVAVLAGSEQYVTPHWHFVIYVQGSVNPGDFAGMVKSHLNNSSVAKEANHSVEDAVFVQPAADMELKPIGKQDREKGMVSPPARYVATQLPHIAGSQGKAFELEHGATCWGYSGRSFRYSKGYDSRPW